MCVFKLLETSEGRDDGMYSSEEQGKTQCRRRFFHRLLRKLPSSDWPCHAQSHSESRLPSKLRILSFLRREAAPGCYLVGMSSHVASAMRRDIFHCLKERLVTANTSFSVVAFLHLLQRKIAMSLHASGCK